MSGVGFFSVGFLGSSGVIIDKADGKLWIMGSALAVEDILWEHKYGFSASLVDLIVEEVSDRNETVNLLMHLVPGSTRGAEYTEKKKALAAILSLPPATFKQLRLWLKIPSVRKGEQNNWFKFRLVDVTESSDANQF